MKAYVEMATLELRKNGLSTEVASIRPTSVSTSKPPEIARRKTIARGTRHLRSIITMAALTGVTEVPKIESMTILKRLRHPRTLRWWEWGKILGFLGLVWLLTAILLGYIPSPAIMALVLHFAIDFTLQSPKMAMRKVERGPFLVMHALIAGGLPLIIPGLMTGNPLTALIWMAIGAASHWAVDWTRRFGIRNPLLAALADQICHLAVILLLTVVCPH